MESAHAEAACLLIEAGADRERVSSKCAASLSHFADGNNLTDQSRWRDARRSGGRGRTGTAAGEDLRYRAMWQTVAERARAGEGALSLKEAYGQVADRKKSGPALIL